MELRAFSRGEEAGGALYTVARLTSRWPSPGSSAPRSCHGTGNCCNKSSRSRARGHVSHRISASRHAREEAAHGRPVASLGIDERKNHAVQCSIENRCRRHEIHAFWGRFEGFRLLPRGVAGAKRPWYLPRAWTSNGASRRNTWRRAGSRAAPRRSLRNPIVLPLATLFNSLLKPF